MPLAQGDDMIDALATDRSDQPLGEAVLPGRARDDAGTRQLPDRPVYGSTTRGTRRNRLAFGGRQAHKSPMDKLQFDRADYSVVVKNRAPPPKAWRWEIYRAGNASSIRQSPIYFDTVMAARRAGKEALKKLLDKLFS